jgi:prepilin-type N-terminal cleavage/methylation domain-containing protein
MKSPKQAFTLIEVLIVITIIAIVAAILLPVFAKAREFARRTSCVSNVKQITAALMLYVQDHDETFPSWNVPYRPPARCGDAQDMAWYRYGLLLQPYAKNTQVFVCPSYPPNDWKWSGSLYTSCYGGNWPPVGWRGNSYDLKLGATSSALTLAQVAHPAQTLLLYENKPVHSATADGFWDCVADTSVFNAMVFQGGFADGHVKMVAASQHRLVRKQAWGQNVYPCLNFDLHWWIAEDGRNVQDPMQGWDVD